MPSRCQGLCWHSMPCPLLMGSLWGTHHIRKVLEQSWAQSSPDSGNHGTVVCFNRDHSFLACLLFFLEFLIAFFFPFSPKNSVCLPCVLTFIHLLIILSCPWDSLSSWALPSAPVPPTLPLSLRLPYPYLCVTLPPRRLFIVHSLPCLLRFFSFLLECEVNWEGPVPLSSSIQCDLGEVWGLSQPCSPRVFPVSVKFYDLFLASEWSDIAEILKAGALTHYPAHLC